MIIRCKGGVILGIYDSKDGENGLWKGRIDVRKVRRELMWLERMKKNWCDERKEWYR